MRYIFAAYRKGALGVLGEDFADGSMEPEVFREAFELAVLDNYDGGWTLFAETKQGFVPVGLAFAAWPYRSAHWMIVNAVCWFPWASRRNIVESTVRFFNEMRGQIPMTGYARQEHRRMYEVCAMHGIMRRVGTSYTVTDEPVAVFETRTSP